MHLFSCSIEKKVAGLDLQSILMRFSGLQLLPSRVLFFFVVINYQTYAMWLELFGEEGEIDEPRWVFAWTQKPKMAQILIRSANKMYVGSEVDTWNIIPKFPNVSKVIYSFANTCCVLMCARPCNIWETRGANDCCILFSGQLTLWLYSGFLDTDSCLVKFQLILLQCYSPRDGKHSAIPGLLALDWSSKVVWVKRR